MNKITKELLKVAKLIATNGKEYVIWGVPEGKTSQELLLTQYKGKEITSKSVAKKLANLLEEKYGATKIKIQEIDMEGEFDWMKSIGL